MAFRVEKLADALGAEVSGVDLSQPIAPRTFDEIRGAWLEHLVLRFRGQKLSDPQLLAFSRHFGELDPPGPNPYGKPFLAQHPEMNVISKTFFKDIVDLLPGYDFYRLLPDGLKALGTYKSAHFEIFSFQNIVAIKKMS